MAKKKAVQPFSRVFEQFAGDFVTITLRSLKGGSRRDKVVANVMIAGYLLDECEEFYYIGETVKEIFAAIKKVDVNAIMLGGDEKEAGMEIPEGMEMQ